MNQELLNQIIDEYLDIRNGCLTVTSYQDHVFRWVAIFHMYEEEFLEALRILQQERRYCIPDGKLNMSCHYPCDSCHKNLKKDLINRINNPFKLRV